MWGATYISYPFQTLYNVHIMFKKHPLQNRTNVQIKGGGGQRPFEQCSKELHFSYMEASLISSIFSFQFPLLFAMLFLNFFADAQPKYVDLEGTIHLLSIIISSEYLLYSASRRPNSRGVCLLPLQDDLLLVASIVTLQGDLM